MKYSLATRVSFRHNLPSSFQVVPRTLVGQRGWEAADGERQEWQLPGEREPEPSGGFRSVRPYRGRQDGHQWQQTQSDSRHDPLSGKQTPHRLRETFTAECACATALHADANTVQLNWDINASCDSDWFYNQDPAVFTHSFVSLFKKIMPTKVWLNLSWSFL